MMQCEMTGSDMEYVVKLSIKIEPSTHLDDEDLKRCLDNFPPLEIDCPRNKEEVEMVMKIIEAKKAELAAIVKNRDVYNKLKQLSRSPDRFWQIPFNPHLITCDVATWELIRCPIEMPEDSSGFDFCGDDAHAVSKLAPNSFLAKAITSKLAATTEAPPLVQTAEAPATRSYATESRAKPDSLAPTSESFVKKPSKPKPFNLLPSVETAETVTARSSQPKSLVSHLYSADEADFPPPASFNKKKSVSNSYVTSDARPIGRPLASVSTRSSVSNSYLTPHPHPPVRDPGSISTRSSVSNAYTTSDALPTVRVQGSVSTRSSAYNSYATLEATTNRPGLFGDDRDW